MTKLRALADAVDLKGKIDAMFGGEHLNTTEDRAVLHVALRANRDQVSHPHKIRRIWIRTMCNMLPGSSQNISACPVNRSWADRFVSIIWCATHCSF